MSWNTCWGTSHIWCIWGTVEAGGEYCQYKSRSWSSFKPIFVTTTFVLWTPTISSITHTRDHPHSVAWMRAQFCRGLRWLAAIHPSSHPALRSNHSTPRLFISLQTIGKAAFTSSKHSLNFQDCTIWWKPLKTLSYSHGFTIGQQFSSVNVTKINLFGNIGDTETLLWHHASSYTIKMKS